MWWIVWLVIMVVVPCLEGLHVLWDLRAPAEEPAEAGAPQASYDL